MPRTNTPTLPMLVGWRLVIAASALAGFVLTFKGRVPYLAYLSQESNLLTGVSFIALAVLAMIAGGRRGESFEAWLRGALTVLMLLVGGTYLTIMHGPLNRPGYVLAHVITPVLVLLDWVVLGGGRRRGRWWAPLTWLGFPLAYLVFYVAYGRRLYRFLDPHGAGFVWVVLGFLVGFLVLGYLVAGIAALRCRSATTRPDPPRQDTRGPVADATIGRV